MKTTLLFLGGVGFQELFVVLFVIAFIFLLFLALRALVLLVLEDHRCCRESAEAKQTAFRNSRCLKRKEVTDNI